MLIYSLSVSFINTKLCNIIPVHLENICLLNYVSFPHVKLFISYHLTDFKKTTLAYSTSLI